MVSSLRPRLAILWEDTESLNKFGTARRLKRLYMVFQMGFGSSISNSTNAAMHKPYVSSSRSMEHTDQSKGLRDHPKYRLEQPNILNRATPESASFRGAGSSHQSGSPMPRLSPCDTIFSPGRYTANGRSIFVGNLPPSAIEEGVLQIFSVYGDIIHIEIIRKAFANGQSSLCFPFQKTLLTLDSLCFC